jgi:hypothetical protein
MKEIQTQATEVTPRLVRADTCPRMDSCPATTALSGGYRRWNRPENGSARTLLEPPTIRTARSSGVNHG